VTIQMTVSVIIPTHNRCRLLLCLLDALGAQTYPAEGIEVIVVADGCVDDTVSLVREYTAPYWLKLHEQPARGVSVARNQGAGLAHGELLLFLDDDVIPTPACIAAHVAAHVGQRDRAVIGYYPARLEPDAGYFGVALQGWWERAFQQMEEPGHIWSYRDVMSGNLSLRAGLFQAVGGFHPAFRRHNDQEFGVRLLAAGARLHFSATPWPTITMAPIWRAQYASSGWRASPMSCWPASIRRSRRRCRLPLARRFSAFWMRH